MKRISKEVFEIIPKKLILCKREPIKHFFKCDDGFMVRNLRFNIHFCKWNPKKQRLHIQIWVPLLHIVRDNNKWEIGNRYQLCAFHR